VATQEGSEFGEVARLGAQATTCTATGSCDATAWRRSRAASRCCRVVGSWGAPSRGWVSVATVQQGLREAARDGGGHDLRHDEPHHAAQPGTGNVMDLRPRRCPRFADCQTLTMKRQWHLRRTAVQRPDAQGSWVRAYWSMLRWSLQDEQTRAPSANRKEDYHESGGIRAGLDFQAGQAPNYPKQQLESVREHERENGWELNPSSIHRRFIADSSLPAYMSFRR
jgi:hypothetical protein